MAEEQSPENAAPAAPPKSKVMMLAVAGLIVGGGAGFFGVGPIFAAKKPAAPAKAEAADKEKKEGAEGGGAVVHSLDNLVLNPAGSNGTRFLMVTAAFELKDAGAEQAMKDRESEVRDRLLGVLGKKTVDQLTDISLREGIKKETIDAISPMFGKGALVKVFFPQFVIQ